MEKPKRRNYKKELQEANKKCRDLESNISSLKQKIQEFHQEDGTLFKREHKYFTSNDFSIEIHHWQRKAYEHEKDLFYQFLVDNGVDAVVNLWNIYLFINERSPLFTIADTLEIPSISQYDMKRLITTQCFQTKKTFQCWQFGNDYNHTWNTNERHIDNIIEAYNVTWDARKIKEYLEDKLQSTKKIN